jgi:large subunit ribosomal protein L21
MHASAIIKTGGKQYKVAVGEKIRIEKIPADIDDVITFCDVLSVGSGENIKIGFLLLEKFFVRATVVAQSKYPKVHIFKMRRRKHYQRRMGHRQMFTEIQINEVGFSS